MKFSIKFFFIWLKSWRAQQYKIENDQLHEQIKKAELEINDLTQINQVN